MDPDEKRSRSSKIYPHFNLSTQATWIYGYGGRGKRSDGARQSEKEPEMAYGDRAFELAGVALCLLDATGQFQEPLICRNQLDVHGRFRARPVPLVTALPQYYLSASYLNVRIPNIYQRMSVVFYFQCSKIYSLSRPAGYQHGDQ